MPQLALRTAENSAYVRWFRRIARLSFRIAFRLLTKPVIHGWEHVPARGPYLITPNHLTSYDPALLVSFWPYAPEVLGAANIWASRHFFGFIARGYGTYPVYRDQMDIRAVRLVLGLLKQGKPLLIAPEGGRSPGGLRAGRPGAAYLALKARVPILPVGITGTEKMFKGRSGDRPRWPLTMRIGQLYTLPPLPFDAKHRHQSLQQATDLIMQHIAALLPPAYRGVYAPQTSGGTS